jgi:hypothetical protein
MMTRKTSDPGIGPPTTLNSEALPLPEIAPYRASWLDYLFDRIRSLPGKTWLVYGALTILLFLFFSALAWLNGLQPVGLALLVAIDEAIYIVYYLALMHYLDTVAAHALKQFRPLLQASESDLARLHYELTTLPAFNTLLANIIGIVVTLVSLPYAPTASILSQVTHLPSTQLAFLIGNAIIAVFVYHSIRQLRMVSRIHGMVTHFNFFQRRPIYAFSRLTARTAFGWILGISMGLSPRIAPLLTWESLFLLWIPIVPLAALIFILPLVGVHHLLAREKGRQQADVEERVEAVLLRLHRQQDEDDLSNLDKLKTLLDSLLVERELVAKLPTWPWQPGTVAALFSALLLPLAIWLLQQLLSAWIPGG